MQRDKYLELFKLHYHCGHSHLSRKVSEDNENLAYRRELLADLWAQSLYRCLNKVKSERLDTVGSVRAAIKRQAMDVFSENYQDRKRDIKLLRDLRYLRARDNVESPAAGLELKDIIGFIHRHLTVDEFKLFHFRVFDNLPFETLALYFDKSSDALRKQYCRIRARLAKLLKKSDVR
jgi:hypothetical protein